MKKWFHERLVIIAGFRMWELAHFFIIAEYSVTFCNRMRSRLVLVYYFGEFLKMPMVKKRSVDNCLFVSQRT